MLSEALEGLLETVDGRGHEGRCDLQEAVEVVHLNQMLQKNKIKKGIVKEALEKKNSLEREGMRAKKRNLMKFKTEEGGDGQGRSRSRQISIKRYYM